MPFRTLVGHRPTLSLLARAVSAGTVPPSLLFAGPDGVGKRAAAVALAQAINCPTPVAATPHLASDACGECAVCRRIARGLHPDVTVVEPGDSGAIKIDAVREEIRKTSYKPFEARRRVIIFDQADSLVDDAQNALLKTLEEPPAGTALSLVTAQPNRLLATVRSRCPIIRFGPVPAEEIARWLIDQGIVEPKARAVAAVSGGSLAAARATAEAGIDDVRAAAERVLTALADARDPRVRLLAAQDLIGRGKGTGARERDALAAHLQALAALVRDLVAVSTGSGTVVNTDLSRSLAKLAPSFGIDRLIAAFATLTRALEALERNGSPKIVADWVAVNL